MEWIDGKSLNSLIFSIVKWACRLSKNISDNCHREELGNDKRDFDRLLDRD